MIKLVVGVGNPGSEYEFTRHNIAWIIFDQHPDVNSSTWKSKWKSEYTDVRLDGEKRYFQKPMTFMNLSGEAVRPLCDLYKILPEEVMVIHDDLDLDFGVVKFKFGGGLAGHNGLKSISKHLGTHDYYRMRVGIGKPTRGSVSSWVLSSFKNDEIKDLEKLMIGSVQALDDAMKLDFKKLQNKYNKKNFILDKE